MNPPMTLPTRRTLIWAATTYLLVIVALTIPRVVGSSWRSIMLPGGMRNVEGLPVHWEPYVLLRSIQAMSADTVPRGMVDGYNTDEYRATLPTYFAAIMTQVTESYVIGVTVSEVVWWWFGALSVFVLARSFVSASTAYCAGVLTCASPLGVGHVGSASLHTASSLSLSVLLVIAWRILYDGRLAFVPKVALYGSCLYLSSITYTYQWFLAPFFVVVTAASRSRDRVLASVLGIGIFFAFRLMSYGVLALGGLEVHTHLNDPLRIMQARLSGMFAPTSGHWAAIGPFLADTVADVVVGTVSSYHVVVVVGALIGLLMVRDARFGIASGAAISLGFAFGAVYGLAWVLMSGYPFVYALAAHGMSTAAGAVAMRLPYLREHQYASHALLACGTAVLAAFTNLDLVGDPTFAITWWRWWYIPH